MNPRGPYAVQLGSNLPLTLTLSASVNGRFDLFLHPLVGRHHRLLRASQAAARWTRTAKNPRHVPGVGRRRSANSCSAAGKGSNAVRMRLTWSLSNSRRSTPSNSARRPVVARPLPFGLRPCRRSSLCQVPLRSFPYIIRYALILRGFPLNFESSFHNKTDKTSLDPIHGQR